MSSGRRQGTAGLRRRHRQATRPAPAAALFLTAAALAWAAAFAVAAAGGRARTLHAGVPLAAERVPFGGEARYALAGLVPRASYEARAPPPFSLLPSAARIPAV